MSGGRSIDKERKSPRESGEDSEDESEILEESPCGRWLKRREEVSFYYNLLLYKYIYIIFDIGTEYKHLKCRPEQRCHQLIYKVSKYRKKK